MVETWAKFPYGHDGSGWCWYINANMTGLNLDGIHVSIYTIIHGSYGILWGFLKMGVPPDITRSSKFSRKFEH